MFLDLYYRFYFFNWFFYDLLVILVVTGDIIASFSFIYLVGIFDMVGIVFIECVEEDIKKY